MPIYSMGSCRTFYRGCRRYSGYRGYTRAFVSGLVATMAALVFSGSGVHADPLPTDKLSESAQKAFDQGKFKKAADAWIRAVKTLEDGGQRDLFFESCLKRLGQAYRPWRRRQGVSFRTI